MSVAIPYWQKLQDPRWQRKRLEILERDKFSCQHCDDEGTTLHVHHRYYVSGREPWDYPGFCFVTLCKECHKLVAPSYGPDEDPTAITAWESIVDWLQIGQPIFEDMMWSICLEISRAKDRGMSHHQCLSAMMQAILNAGKVAP